MVAAACGGGDEFEATAYCVSADYCPKLATLRFWNPICGCRACSSRDQRRRRRWWADVEWLSGDSGDNGEVANATVDRLLAEDVDGYRCSIIGRLAYCY